MNGKVLLIKLNVNMDFQSLGIFALIYLVAVIIDNL